MESGAGVLMAKMALFGVDEPVDPAAAQGRWRMAGSCAG